MKRRALLAAACALGLVAPAGLLAQKAGRSRRVGLLLPTKLQATERRASVRTTAATEATMTAAPAKVVVVTASPRIAQPTRVGRVADTATRARSREAVGADRFVLERFANATDEHTKRKAAHVA